MRVPLFIAATIFVLMCAINSPLSLSLSLSFSFSLSLSLYFFLYVYIYLYMYIYLSLSISIVIVIYRYLIPGESLVTPQLLFSAPWYWANYL